MAAAIPIIALAVSAAGTGYSAYSSAQTAKANEKAANLDAEYQENKAEYEAEETKKEGLRVMAEQRAGYAKSGISLLSSSAQDIFGETLEDTYVDMAIIKNTGDINAYKMRTNASNYASSATASTVSGLSSIGSSVLNQYSK